jgi:hypothetical protein
MSKKLMLLAAGALTALAFTALPSLASASEWENHCTSLPCSFTVQATGHTVFSTAAKEGSTHTVTCTTTTGSGSQSALTSKTATVELTFSGCKELDTGFGFACNSPGAAAGTVTTNTMTSDNIWIDAAKTTPGSRLTGINVTFSCGFGLAQTRVTGNIIGHLETPNCGVARNHTTVEFRDTGVDGVMKDNTVTGVTQAGTELEADAGENGVYVSSAQRGTAHLNWNQNVTPTC